MSNNDYTIKSVIICDDARQEVSGKEILIGVYNDIIVVGQLPAILAKFVVRVSAKVTRRDYKSFFLQIVDMAENKIVNVQQDIVSLNDDNVIFGLQIGNLTFAQLGKHDILFGLDRSPTKVSEFEIRTPSSEEERARLTGA